MNIWKKFQMTDLQKSLTGKFQVEFPEHDCMNVLNNSHRRYQRKSENVQSNFCKKVSRISWKCFQCKFIEEFLEEILNKLDRNFQRHLKRNFLKTFFLIYGSWFTLSWIYSELSCPHTSINGYLLIPTSLKNRVFDKIIY